MIYPDIPAHAPTPLPNPTRSPRTGAFAFNQSVAKHILYFPPLRESFKNRSLPFVIPDERLTSRLVFHSSASTVKGADLAMSRSALGSGRQRLVSDHAGYVRGKPSYSNPPTTKGFMSCSHSYGVCSLH